MTLSDLRTLTGNPNIGAMLRVIRERESSQTDDAYRMISGGGLIDITQGWQHPWDGIPTTHGGKACGAYQFLGTTWHNLVQALPGGDFSPLWQDIRCVQLMAERGSVLQAVLAGEIPAAIEGLRPIWTSLPGAAENHGYTMDQALAVFVKYGGRIASQAPAPIEEGTPMPIAALIAAFGPILAQLIPQVAKILNPQPSEVAARNMDAAKVVLDTIVQATNTPNVQAAVEKMQADPAVVAQVQQAIVTHPDIMPLLNVEHVQEARDADAAVRNADKPFWYGQVPWFTVLLLPLVYYTVVMVLGGGANVTQETKSMVIGFIIGTVLGSMVMYFYGTTAQSAKKDDTIAKVATSP